MNHYFMISVSFFVSFYETHFNRHWTIFSRELFVFNHHIKWHKGLDSVVSKQMAVTFIENRSYANLQHSNRTPKRWGFEVPLPEGPISLIMNVCKYH